MNFGSSEHSDSGDDWMMELRAIAEIAIAPLVKKCWVGVARTRWRPTHQPERALCTATQQTVSATEVGELPAWVLVALTVCWMALDSRRAVRGGPAEGSLQARGAGGQDALRDAVASERGGAAARSLQRWPRSRPRASHVPRVASS